jgi:TonB family protein
MKTILFFFFLLLISTCIQAQKIEKYYDYNWKPVEDPARARYYSIVEKKDSGWSRLDYFIREGRLQMAGFFKDPDCKINHGAFAFYHANGYQQSKGKYLNGKRYGTWLWFHENGSLSDSSTYTIEGWVMGTRMAWHANGMIADSTVIHPDGSGVSVLWWDNGHPSTAGRYAPGFKKNGKWQYFHSNGQIGSQETYDHDRLTTKVYYDENGVQQTDTTNRDGEATFPGGLAVWQKFLQKNIYFPSQYKITNADQAVVMVRFAITEDGTVSEVTVTDSFHPDIDKIAVEAVKKSPKWKPAISHNRKMKEYHSQPVTFSQE